MEHNVLGKSRLLHGILQEYYENNPKHIIEQSYYTIEKKIARVNITTQDHEHKKKLI